MLTELSIRNVAIIDKLHLSFKAGLNMFSGETGAGKSIIIDALTLVCGGRASADLIRSGEDEAIVEARFDLEGNQQLRKQLEEAGLAADDELLIRRYLSRTGKNRTYINGSMATLGQLAALGSQLVTIHGQHESQGLLKSDNHLQLLDAFAGTTALRQQFGAQFEKWRQTAAQLASFDDDERAVAGRIDLIAYQTEEIAAANLKAGEEEELQTQQRLLANSERLSVSTGGAFEALYSDDQAILGELRRVMAAVDDAVTVDAGLVPLKAMLNEAYLQLEEAALQLRDYSSRVEADPRRLQQIDDRLDLLQHLKRKYAPTVEEIIELGESLLAELVELESRSSSREDLDQQLVEQWTQLEQTGKELSRQRKKAALQLEQQLMEEIHQLAMPHALVQVVFVAVPEPRSSGMDKVEFLFAPNPGEQARPLARVASGGELSRLMLAFKQILPEGEAPTLVFDEVDTGVGGAVADLVGRKLKNLARNQQVFCITHLPQVAAWAAQHLLVQKQVEDGRAITTVRILEQTEQVNEIARMLAGEQVTEAARGHARELIEQAKNP